MLTLIDFPNRSDVDFRYIVLISNKDSDHDDVGIFKVDKTIYIHGSTGKRS